MNIAIIGAGSNISLAFHIREAIRLIGGAATVTGISSFRKTAPIGITDQPDFINGAIRISTPMARQELEELLKQTEDRLGRDRSLPKFGPRTIDLDLVVWNGEIVDQDYHTRPFLRKSVDELLGEE